MLAAGTVLKLFDFLGLFFSFFFNFNGVLPGNETVIFFFFLAFSVRYNVSFTKIICISMPHRLNVFFSHFSWNSIFLHLKKMEKGYLGSSNCNMFYQFVLYILYYRLYDLQI